MKKAVYQGARALAVEEAQVPQPGPGQVQVRVRYCGICGSDLHEYLHGLFPVSPFGHEVVGEVSRLGPGVTGLEPGDRVVAVGPGGFAQYHVAGLEHTFKLPDGISWERAALVEPLAGAANALSKVRVEPGCSVFIAGAGPVGLLLLMAARASGAGSVFISDFSPARLKLAASLGASQTIDAGQLKVPARVRELTGGRGADISIEAVGVPASLKDCLAATRYQGAVVVQGIFTQKAEVHMLGFVTKEMTMIGSNQIDLPQALEWAAGSHMAPEAIITSVISLDDIVEKGFEALVAHKDREIKILVDPWR